MGTIIETQTNPTRPRADLIPVVLFGFSFKLRLYVSFCKAGRGPELPPIVVPPVMLVRPELGLAPFSVPLHPAQTCTGHDEAVAGIVCEVFCALADPPDIWSVATFASLTYFNHGRRLVHRVDVIHKGRQGPCHVPGPTPNVQYNSRFVLYKAIKHLEDFRRVRRVVDVSVGNAPVFELVGVIRSEVLGFGMVMECALLTENPNLLRTRPSIQLSAYPRGRD